MVSSLFRLRYSKANSILISCLIHLNIEFKCNKVIERARRGDQIKIESGTVAPESRVAK